MCLLSCTSYRGWGMVGTCLTLVSPSPSFTSSPSLPHHTCPTAYSPPYASLPLSLSLYTHSLRQKTNARHNPTAKIALERWRGDLEVQRHDIALEARVSIAEKRGNGEHLTCSDRVVEDFKVAFRGEEGPFLANAAEAPFDL